MKWLKSLSLYGKKRTQQEAASQEQDAQADVEDISQPSPSSDEEGANRPKRRSVSREWDRAPTPPQPPAVSSLHSPHLQPPLAISPVAEALASRPRASTDHGIRHSRSSVDRSEKRSSLDLWHEARRVRNSIDGHIETVTTDKLTVHKAGHTTIVNKTYITIKHLGSGTFGKVMLCFNVSDHKLYALKICRKSQFASAQNMNGNSRRRRNSYASWAEYSSGFLNGGTGSGGSGGGVASCSTGGISPISETGPADAAASATGAAAAPAVAAAAAGASSSPVAGPQPARLSADVTVPRVFGQNNLVPSLNVFAAGAGSGKSAGGSLRRPLSFNVTARASGGGGSGNGIVDDAVVAPGFSSRSSSGGGAFTDREPGQRATASPQQQSQPQARTFLKGPAGRQFSSPPPPSHSLRQHHSFDAGTSAAAVAAANALSGVGSGSGLISSMSVNGTADAPSRLRTEDLVKEIAILKKLAHPNVVALCEVIDDPTTDSLLLVMEYVEGRTLEPRRVDSNHWERLPELEVWKLVREVLQGLDYLHYNQVVHGDLKPANLLLDSNTGKVKIVDFGSSIMADADKSGGAAGVSGRTNTAFSTPAFRSPESLMSGYRLSFEMDMWALGVCIYMWVFGELPFRGAAPCLIYEKIKAQDVTFAEATNISGGLREFMSQLLCKNVVARMDVQRAMTHPWVTLGGRAPLPSVRQAALHLRKVRVTPQDIATAVRHAEEGTAELMDVVLEERTYTDGAQLIRAGEPADRIFLLARGEVEIYLDDAAAPDGGAGIASQPIISGADLALAEAQEHDMVIDLQVTDPVTSPAGHHIVRDLHRAMEARRSSSGGTAAAAAAAKRLCLLDGRRRVLAVKGPGESLGLPKLQLGTGQHTWKAHVRARSEVVAFVARVDDLVALVERHPEVEKAVQEMVVQHETDMMVAEAMKSLRLFSHTSPPASTSPEHGPLPMEIAAS